MADRCSTSCGSAIQASLQTVRCGRCSGISPFGAPTPYSPSTTSGATRLSTPGRFCRSRCESTWMLRTMRRSARHEPAGECRKCPALRFALPSMGPSVAARACPVCGGTPPSGRSVYCKTACKQLAYRLRHQRLASVDPVILREQLQRQRLLVAHTVYACPRCDERYLGERRCASCQLYCRALG